MSVNVKVFITKVATGETREHVDLYNWPDAEAAVWQYTDGNYSCDCNRGLFFGDYGIDDEHSCGHSAYTVRLEDASGTVLMDDANGRDWPDYYPTT